MCKTNQVVITSDSSTTLRHATHGESYHSIHGALTESTHVFIEAGGLKEKLSQHQKTNILEIGLGTGLNFRLANACAHQYQTPIHYTAFETNPISPQTLSTLKHHQLFNDKTIEEKLAVLFSHSQFGESHTVNTGLSTLEFKHQDATTATLAEAHYDCIFLDAFSPKHCPELWTLSFLNKLATSLKPGGRLSTYAARGQLVRDLKATNLTVQKRPGPPGKRECLTADKI